MAEAPTTRKVQLSVPVADISVIEWLDLQYSPAESVRRLIRESVAREGFIDVANRPVRPPAHPQHVPESFPPDTEGVPGTDEALEAGATSRMPAPEPPTQDPAPTRRSVRSDNAEATATIDDLLGL